MNAAAAPELSEPTAEIEVAFREARPSDEATINSAFLRGLRESPYANGLPNATFFSMARQAWGGIQRDMETTIAHVPSDQSEVMGFITHAKDERGTPGMAWLYVAKPWRGMHVGKRLLERAGITPRLKFAVLFANPKALALYRSKGYQPVFVPFACWRWLNQEAA